MAITITKMQELDPATLQIVKILANQARLLKAMLKQAREEIE